MKGLASDILQKHLQSNKGTQEKKRILSLDGGGLKGLVTIGILEKLEVALKNENGGDPSFRLSDHFDLIAGTSTGAIIAAALALGWTVEEVKKTYFQLGDKVFKKRLWQGRLFGLINDKYSDRPLTNALKEAYGENTTLGSDKLRTGLLVVAKRIDTGSPWPLTNNYNSKYFEPDIPRKRVGNKDYRLWKIVTASAAASTYFKPQKIEIFESNSDFESVIGDFIDGGLSPYNDPALLAVMIATIKGYGFNWALDHERLQVVSIGTGLIDVNVKGSWLATKRAIRALTSLMNDSADLQKLMLQWMSESKTAIKLDSEVGRVEDDFISGNPVLEYLRYDADMTKVGIEQASQKIDIKRSPKNLKHWDNPKNMETYYEIGRLAGDESIEISQLV